MNHHLVALCHQSRRLLYLCPKTRTRRATALMTQRPFFSFLGGNNNSSSSSSTYAEAETRKKVKQQEEATRILLDGVYHRISVQHAHPLGPWHAISTVVQDHYRSWLEAQEAAQREKEVNTANVIVMSHHQQQQQEGDVLGIASTILSNVFRVLDLACGPRGEPGTTVAHALPLAAVHCTDSCSVAVAAIPVHVYVGEASNSAAADSDVKRLVEKENSLSEIGEDESTIQVTPLLSSYHCPLIPPPPKNLTKSITDLTDLSSYESNSFDAIICCYGYNLSSNVPHALSEAYRVLVPGGILVIATWERSAMLAIGRDVVAFVRGGGRDPYNAEDDESFLPPRIVPVNKIELSGVGEMEGLLVASGFDQPHAIVAASLIYPIDLGSTSADQVAMGTILVRDELESLGALTPPSTDGAWESLVEEAFWMNIPKYADEVEGNLLLRDNKFKLTVSTKKQCE